MATLLQAWPCSIRTCVWMCTHVRVCARACVSFWRRKVRSQCQKKTWDANEADHDGLTVEWVYCRMYLFNFNLITQKPALWCEITSSSLCWPGCDWFILLMFYRQALVFVEYHQGAIVSRGTILSVTYFKCQMCKMSKLATLICNNPRHGCIYNVGCWEKIPFPCVKTLIKIKEEAIASAARVRSCWSWNWPWWRCWCCFWGVIQLVGLCLSNVIGKNRYPWTKEGSQNGH